jgi:hypothetical protein
MKQSWMSLRASRRELVTINTCVLWSFFASEQRLTRMAYIASKPP